MFGVCFSCRGPPVRPERSLLSFFLSQFIDHQTAPEQTTIILRDAPAATTEKDIRSVFTAAKTEVTNVRPDVGNTWFVSLDAKTTSRDDVVSLLLSLRGMKLRGEPIKARLKTESAAARQGPGGAGGGYGYAASAPQSPVTGRPGQFQQQDAGSVAVTGGNMAGQQGRGSGGGTRPPHMQQSHSVPSSPMAGGGMTHYGGGKAGGKGGKNIVALNSGVGNKSRQGSRGGKDGGGKPAGSAVTSGTVSSPKQAGAAARASANIPPPPLAGLHFPALGDKKPDSQLHHRPKGAAPPKDAEEANGKDSDISKDTSTQSAAPKQSTGGYAAALRKAAPAASAVIGSADEKVRL